MKQPLFSLIAARLQHRQANFQRGFAPLAIVWHGPVFRDRPVELIEFDFERPVPSLARDFRAALLVVDKYPCRRLSQSAAFATDQSDTEKRLAQPLPGIAVAAFDVERNTRPAGVFVELTGSARLAQSLPGARLPLAAEHVALDKFAIVEITVAVVDQRCGDAAGEL